MCQLFLEIPFRVANGWEKCIRHTLFISGMLSKSKGQILRVAAVMHALFHWETPVSIPSDISNVAIEAAIKFVEYCNQQTCYLCGRGDIGDEIEEIQTQGKTA